MKINFPDTTGARLWEDLDMAEFTAITTQEQLDAIIGERLKRERETLSKKYADYDDIKKKAGDYEKQISDLTRSMEETAQKYTGYDRQLEELQGKLRAHETASVKTRIAHEYHIPYELAGRLSGETEEDIKKDAESLAQFIAKAPAAPLREPENHADAKTAALRQLTAELTRKGD